MQSIGQWLASLGLERYAASFESNDVDMSVLAALSEADLETLGVSLGHRKRILLALQRPRPSLGADIQPSTPVQHGAESLTAEGERRQVTVLFCDLVASTALSNCLDPEDYRSVLARYHEMCIASVQRFDGYVAQIQGDGVLAYFGYPLAHEGEAERAIRAALAIVQTLSALDVGLGHPLSVRIGVASGLVVVSHVLAPEKSAVGETPNLAQRLQTLADPGVVLASERARTLAGGAFDYQDRGVHALKGIAEPARVWRVVGPSGAASRFDAATRGGVMPMVGREQEMALVLDRWQLSRTGEGQVVLLEGEPGIGKSRILRAFREVLGNRLEIALQYQCSPYYSNSAFYPIADHLERALRFEREDTIGIKIEKLERRLIEQLRRSRTDCNLLCRALSLPAEGRYGALDMSPQRQKDETITLLVDIVAQIAQRHATVLLFEDAHWADPSTVEVLNALVYRTERLPLLVLMTYRPEFRPPWEPRAHITPVALTRLSRAQGAKIVLRVAENKVMPADLVAQIVDKTDGVPLFIEELTKTVLESDLLVDAGGRYDYSGALDKLAIPATLRDSLMARLDRLIPVKEIAQIGAVLGREFSYELVRAVSPMSEAQLDEALAKLTASELVFRRGNPPDALYTFKHALVQDAAYDSLLKSKRQQLHAEIAEVIRERFPSKAETDPELLAHHYTEAGMLHAAIPCWQRAGELAQKHVALQEAIWHYERGVELSCMLAPSPERDTSEIRLRALLSMAYVALQGYSHPQVAINLEPAWRLDQSLDHGDYTLRILWGMWVTRLCTGQIDESLVWAKRLLSRAEEVDSEDMRIVGHWTACNSYFFLGEPLQCVHHADAVLASYQLTRHAHIADLLNNDPKTVALIYRAGAEWLQGFPEQAAATAALAIAHAEERKHPFDWCFVRHFGIRCVYAPCGDLDRVAVLIDQMERYATEQRLVFFKDVAVPLGRALRLVGAEQHAEAYFACGRALQSWTAAGQMIGVPLVKAAQAVSAVGCDRPDEALKLADEALAQIARPGWKERYALAEVLRVKASAFWAQGAGKQAEALFQQALDTARAQNARSWELRTATSFARMLKEQGRFAEALDILQPTYGGFTEGHYTKDLRLAAALLADLEAKIPASAKQPNQKRVRSRSKAEGKRFTNA